MDTLLFYFLKSSYCNLFRGVAECYAFSRFHDNVGLRDFPAIRHIESANAVVDELIDHIEVGERFVTDGHTHRDIKIFYRFVGQI